jgi:hypothetical protein
MTLSLPPTSSRVDSEQKFDASETVSISTISETLYLCSEITQLMAQEDFIKKVIYRFHTAAVSFPITVAQELS